MDDGYELVEYRLDEDHVFWELKKTSHNLSELQKAMADSRLRESCHKLFLQLGKYRRMRIQQIIIAGRLQAGFSV